MTALGDVLRQQSQILADMADAADEGMLNAPSDVVLNLRGVAQLLSMSEETVSRLASRGEIPGRKVGQQWRFSRRLVLDSLRGD